MQRFEHAMSPIGSCVGHLIPAGNRVWGRLWSHKGGAPHWAHPQVLWPVLVSCPLLPD